MNQEEYNKISIDTANAELEVLSEAITALQNGEYAERFPGCDFQNPVPLLRVLIVLLAKVAHYAEYYGTEDFVNLLDKFVIPKLREEHEELWKQSIIQHDLSVLEQEGWEIINYGDEDGEA